MGIDLAVAGSNGSCSARSEAEDAAAVLLKDAFRRRNSNGMAGETLGRKEERLQRRIWRVISGEAEFNIVGWDA